MNHTRTLGGAVRVDQSACVTRPMMRATHARTSTPHELLWHMTGVVGYARTVLRGSDFEPPPLESVAAELERFHATLELLRDDFAKCTLAARITDEQILRGPPRRHDDARGSAGDAASAFRHSRPVGELHCDQASRRKRRRIAAGTGVTGCVVASRPAAAAARSESGREVAERGNTRSSHGERPRRGATVLPS